MEAVSVRDVAVGFGDVNIFRNLSMDIEKGEFIVLLGPSGCGKSTLLNAIAGLLDVKAGQVWIDGRNVTWDEPKDRGIGMVFQSYSLYPRMSVEMNLSFGLRIAKVPKDEIAKRVAKASKLLQLDPLLKRKPSELSGDSASASPSAARWFATSTSSCSTNRSPISTPSCATNCGWRLRSSIRRSATP